MNTKTIERLLLLEQTGELAPKQRRQLDAELATSPAARQLQKRLRTLSAAAVTPAATPAPEAAARIVARLQQKPKPAFVLLPAWKPALAAAAALALLVGVRTAHYSRPGPVVEAVAVATIETEEWTDPFDAEFTELESLLLAISSDDSLEITEL